MKKHKLSKKIYKTIAVLCVLFYSLAPLGDITVYAAVEPQYLYVNTIVMEEPPYNNEYVNVTSLTTNANTSHSHIFKEKYNNTHHWNECIICGLVQNTKVHTLKTTYSISENTCSPSNIRMEICTDNCGYSNSTYYSSKQHTKNNIPTTSIYDYSHYYTCSECGTGQDVEGCRSSDGTPITKTSPRGTKCVICNYIYDKYCVVLISSTKPSFELIDNETNLLITYTAPLPTGFSHLSLNSYITVRYYADDSANARSVYPVSSKLDGNNVVNQYILPLRDVTNKYFDPIYCNESRNYSNSDTIYIQNLNGGTYLTNFSDPIINSVTLYKADGTVFDNIPSSKWINEGSIEVSGLIVGSYVGYVSLFDEKGIPIFENKAVTINADNTFKCTSSLTGIEADENGKLFIVRVKDYFGKEVSSNKIIYKVDEKTPELMNKSSLNLTDGWAKEKRVAFLLNDAGCRNVQTSINTPYSYADAVQIDDMFLKTYSFIGDIYVQKNCVIYYQDALGNYSTTVFPVNKIDNTPPTITSFSPNTTELVKSLSLTATANDFNTALNAEGSGDLKYKFYSNDESINAANKLLNTWQSIPNVPIYENGTYFLDVIDAVGNMTTSQPLVITNIDSIPPTVNVMISNSSDGKYKIITIYAADENADGTVGSGLKSDGDDLDCFNVVATDNAPVDVAIADKTLSNGKYHTAIAQFKTNENKSFVVRVQDNVLNSTVVSITVEAGDLSFIDGIDAENLNLTSNYPDWTNGTVRLTAHINNPSYGYSWSWDYSEDTNGTWFKGLYGVWNNILSSYSQFSVSTNGTYHVAAIDENGTLYRSYKEIKNIDKTPPTCTVSVNEDNNYIIVKASDSESGVDYIMVDGGTLSTIKKIDCNGAQETEIAVQITSNGNYKIMVHDRAGNISDSITKTVSTVIPEQYYKVKFLNYDDSIIKSQLVKEGGDATPPSNVTRQNYTFTGWSDSYTDIRSDKTLKAQFSTISNFTVNFLNYDGSFLKSEKVAEGGSATPPSNVTRTGYTFTGWSGSYSNITENTTVTATFIKNETQEDLKSYTVDFLNYDGSVIKSEKVAEGGSATPPSNVTRVGYTFAGWSDSYSNISINTKVTATFIADNELAELKSYTVDFCNDNGSILKSQLVKEGTDATPPTNTTKNGYTFTGWDVSYSNIRKDTKVTAVYSKDEEKPVKTENDTYYSVSFLNYDGSVITSEKVLAGGNATPPQTVIREGYTFTGWSAPYSMINQDVAINATFIRDPEQQVNERIEKHYTVNFCHYDESVIKSEKVLAGGSATPPTNVSRSGYTFNGWSASYSNIQADTAVKALFVQSPVTKSAATSSQTRPTQANSNLELAEANISKGTILLTEYTEAAFPLAIAEKSTPAFVTVEKNNDKIVNYLHEDEIPSTTEKLITQEDGNEKGLNSKQVIAIVVLALSGLGIVFYFLNKKFFWVDLPF